MARKWIINDNQIIMGNVSLHRDLALNHDDTIGGGYYYYLEEDKVMLFYSSSMDFGQVTADQFNDAEFSRRSLIGKVNSKFYTEELIENVLKLYHNEKRQAEEKA